MVYGHRNGFDHYDRAYIDMRGKIVFKKTLYIDLGINSKKGYSFSKTLWKAFDIFQPVTTPHLPFSEVMFNAATQTISRPEEMFGRKK